jgi:hypothetical protein
MDTIDISTPANWFGIIGGIALFVTWIRGIVVWFRAKISLTRDGAKFGESLATELLASATNPARRADIYAYVQFICIEMEADHTRRLIWSVTVGFATVLLGFIMILLHRFIDLASWFGWLAIFWYVLLAVSYVMALFFGKQLRLLQTGWHKRAKEVLYARALEHVSET